MGNTGSLCCDGDNSREIKQVRQVVTTSSTAFTARELVQQHSGAESNILRPFAFDQGTGGQALKAKVATKLQVRARSTETTTKPTLVVLSTETTSS